MRWEERNKRNSLEEQTQAAKRLIQDRRYAEAVDRLRLMQPEFAGDAQFTELLAFAEEEWRCQVKDEEIGDLIGRAAQHNAQPVRCGIKSD